MVIILLLIVLLLFTLLLLLLVLILLLRLILSLLILILLLLLLLLPPDRAHDPQSTPGGTDRNLKYQRVGGGGVSLVNCKKRPNCSLLIHQFRLVCVTEEVEFHEHVIDHPFEVLLCKRPRACGVDTVDKL